MNLLRLQRYNFFSIYANFSLFICICQNFFVPLQPISDCKRKDTKYMAKDIITLLREIDASKVDLEKVDWTAYARELLELSELIKTPNQGFGWLYGMFALIGDFGLRDEVILQVLNAAYDLEKEFKQARRFEEDLMCIADIAKFLEKDSVSAPNYPRSFANCITWRQQGTGDILGKQYLALDELAWYYTIKDRRASKLIGYTQQLYLVAQQGIQESWVTNLVHGRRHDDGLLHIKTLEDFCKYLYLAQGQLCKLFEGRDDFNEIPTFYQMDKSLREECFEEYIKLRASDIFDIDEQWGSKQFHEEDYYEQIHQESKICLNHAIKLRDYRDAFEYHQIWRKGHESIIDLMQYFVDYIQRKAESKVEGQPGTTIIINGNVANAIGKVQELKSNNHE